MMVLRKRELHSRGPGGARIDDVLHDFQKTSKVHTLEARLMIFVIWECPLGANGAPFGTYKLYFFEVGFVGDDIQKIYKVVFWRFLGMGLPGVENVRTPRESSQLPHMKTKQRRYKIYLP